MPHIVFTVTNDLSYDQRMQRICSSVSGAGYSAMLVGRKLKSSSALPLQNFTQKRLNCIFTKGALLYLEYNIRLFFYLLFTKADAFCAIDLDTILPVYFASAARGKKRVYDAHELFTEQKEIVTRRNIHRFWLAIEQFAVPKFKYGYTVNHFIKEEFKRRYGADYTIVRNLPLRQNIGEAIKKNTPTIIYQGAVNEGRSFETLIPAMKQVNAKLLICGKGNFFSQAKALIAKHQLEDKIELKGAVAPHALQQLTPQCHIGVTLFEATGLNQYHSLANRFFDYMMAGIPQVCVNYPEYALIHKQYHFCELIDNTSEETIAQALNKLLLDDVLYKTLEANCLTAAAFLNWREEEKILIGFWKGIL